MARFEAFWELICTYRYFLRLAFMLVVFLFVLAVLGLLFAERGTNAYAISIVNFALIAVLGVFVAGLNWVCANREREYY